jgi:preprotein translocase subunit SecY
MSGLARLRNMFRVPDLRKKILFTIFIILIFRIGSHIPVPYVDFESVQNLSQNARDNPNGGVLGLLNTFSGGALTSVSVFFLGIMPYITASIIMQLLGVVIPKLEEWQKEGQGGQKKITQWTRYLTVALALMQSTAFVFVLKSGNGGLLGQSSFRLQEGQVLIPNFTSYKAMMIVITWTAGTALVMWLGELVTQRGIGNGMSILIFTSVVSRLPYEGALVLEQAGGWKFAFVLAMVVAMIFAIVTVESGQRRIPVQFAKRVVGRRMYGGQSTYIPLKVNQSGVIPVIFATSLLSFPALLATVLGDGPRKWVQDHLVGNATTSWFYIGMFAVLILFFSYFYTAIAFNPEQQADIIRKQGGFIPGIRPGPPTERYLAKVLNRITLPGAVFLTLIAVTPFLVLKAWNINMPFGGVSILIAVGVMLETFKQLDSQLMMRNYEGFLH